MDCPSAPEEEYWLRDFPNDLWRLIFAKAKLSRTPINPGSPIRGLLRLRTVCKSWNKLICASKTINSQGIEDLRRIPTIFTSLKSYNISREIPNLNLLTSLRTLRIKVPSDAGGGRQNYGWHQFTYHPEWARDLSEFSRLTNLTELILSSNVHMTSLGPLTNIQSLHLSKYSQVNPKELKRLEKLTRLIRWPDANLGDWKYSGYGGIWFEDGSVYRGTLVDNQRKGRGVTTWMIGDQKYEGEHEAPEIAVKSSHALEGKGTFHFKSGLRFEGVYANGDRVGFGVLHYPNDVRLECHYSRDWRRDNGIVYFPDGDRWECNFKDHKPQGNGVLYCLNGKEERECSLKEIQEMKQWVYTEEKSPGRF